MRFFKNFLKAANGILTVAVAALLLLAGVYSVYSIWDNSTVYAEVDEAMAGLMEHKPETEGDNCDHNYIRHVVKDDSGIDSSVLIIGERCCFKRRIDNSLKDRNRKLRR